MKAIQQHYLEKTTKHISLLLLFVLIFLGTCTIRKAILHEIEIPVHTEILGKTVFNCQHSTNDDNEAIVISKTQIKDALYFPVLNKEVTQLMEEGENFNIQFSIETASDVPIYLLFRNIKLLDTESIA